MSGLPLLRSLPSDICTLSLLEELNVTNCINLEQLPAQFFHLQNLQHLRLSGTKLTWNPVWQIHFPNLKTLHLYDSPDQYRPIPNFDKHPALFRGFQLHTKELLVLIDFEHQFGAVNISIQIKKAHVRSLKVRRFSTVDPLPKNIRLPKSLINLRFLEHLDISELNLTEIPDYIGEFTYLTELVANQNSLSELPESISNLSQLQYLEVQYNRIQRLPNSLTALHKLNILKINNNQLLSLPPGLDLLSDLMVINFTDNPMLQDATQLPYLQELESLSYNRRFKVDPIWNRQIKKSY